MKKILISLIFLIFTPSVFADWFYNSEHVTANIDISSYAEVVPITTRGYIDSATINLTFFPKETDEQEILDFHTTPEAEVSEKAAKFTWKRPQDRIDFRIISDVKTTNTIKQIREKIGFPVQELPEDVIAYTKPSETIDSDNDAIVRLASELVKGEDNLYSAVFKIADWTKNNIEYNLSTLTAEVSQKASWVLQNKQGVCDELTSLFIAMLRSVGIPARFVSGIAYTNSELFPEKWGPHGWAEVYFPEYGWVPFDITYGEFGWIDPTHIKFKDAVDSDEPSAYYQWLGRNADLNTYKLKIETNLVEYSGYIKPNVRVEASVLHKEVDLKSYNLVEATVENLEDFYYGTELYLTKPKEVKIVGNEFRSILLLPKEKKKVYWILKINGGLDNRYSYTFPLVASTINNVTSETSFESSVRNKYVSFEEVQKTASLLDEEKEKKYSGNVFLSCKAPKDEFYEYEKPEAVCIAKNTGNIFIDDADACFDERCYKTSLGISQSKNFTFDINTSRIGHNKAQFTFRSPLVSKTFYLEFNINDKPLIEIEDLSFPENISYSGNFTISFILGKKSQSNPKKIIVTVTQNNIDRKWLITELEESRKFVLSVEGEQLKYGKNGYRINLIYSDALGRQYSAEKEFSIRLTDATITQRLLLFMNNFEGLGTEAISIMLLTGTIVFIGVVIWLFRRGRKL